MAYSNELYQQVILEHNRKPRNFHTMENSTHSCHGYNPLCGDDYEIYLNVDDQNTIQEVSFIGTGCAISKASTSLMTAFLKGKTADEAKMVFEEFHKMVLGKFDPEKEKRLKEAMENGTGKAVDILSKFNRQNRHKMEPIPTFKLGES